MVINKVLYTSEHGTILGGKYGYYCWTGIKKWKDSLNVADLDNYDITVANIIINNYDELRQSGGTATGKRISKFVNYINEKRCL